MSACFYFMKFRIRIFSKVNNIINNIFSDKYLLYTNVGLSIALSGCGDVIEQNYEILNHDLEKWDKIRTRDMSIYGMAVGVFCHYWYSYLDRQLPGYTIRTVAKKIVIDQFVASPVCITALFLTTAALQKKSTSDMLSEFKQKAWILYAAEWTIWPPAQFINFYFLSTKYRVLFDNSVSLVYDIFTSHIKYKEMNVKTR